MNGIFPATITLACLLACTTVNADVHKCTDAQGNVSYRDTPCGDVSTAFKRRSPPAAAPNSDERMDKTRRLLRAYEEERQEKNEKQAEARAEKEKRVRNCALSKDRLRQFERAGRLYSLDKEGKRLYHSDAEREQSIARARASVAEWCN